MSELRLERITGDDVGGLARYRVLNSDNQSVGAINEKRDLDGRSETPTYVALVGEEGTRWHSPFCSSPQAALAQLEAHLGASS